MTNTTLSKKRISITLLLFACIPLSAWAINILTRQYTMSLACTMNLFGSIMIFYDWNLVAIHYNRAKYHLPEAILYILIGIACCSLWYRTAYKINTTNLAIPTAEVLIRYGYARPAMLLAYSYMEATVFSILFKVSTDHIDIHGREFQTILLSGILSGALITLAFSEPNLLSFLQNYLYNTVLVIILSYLYNQSHSLVPGIISLGTVNVIIMLLSIQ